MAASSSGDRSDSPSTSARAIGATSSGNVASILTRARARARSIHASTPIPRRTIRPSTTPPERSLPWRDSRGLGSPSFHRRVGGAIWAMTSTSSPRAIALGAPKSVTRPDQATPSHSAAVRVPPQRSAPRISTGETST